MLVSSPNHRITGGKAPAAAGAAAACGAPQRRRHRAAAAAPAAAAAAPPPPQQRHPQQQRHRRPRAAAAAAAGASSPHICVVGGGVAGLTTALRLLQEVPSARVLVLAEHFGADTTTHGAAGYWEPFKLSATPEEKVHRWGKATFDHLQGLLHSPAAAPAGVSAAYSSSLFRAPAPDPFWSDTVGGFGRLRAEQLALYSRAVDWEAPCVVEAGGGGGGAAAWVDGYAFNSVVCEGRHYMRWLTERIRAAGGSLEQRGLNGLGDLAGEGFDAVVVACGLGARGLLGDAECHPIRGQIARVRAPWVRQCVFGHWGGEVTYLIPNRDFVVVGGTGQVDDWRTSACLADHKAMMARAVQLLPSIADAELIDEWVGLRPGRSQLRLELEWVQLQGAASGDGDSSSGGSGSSSGDSGSRRPAGATPVVYNYGHGGAGLTLAWGTAGDAVALVKKGLGSA